MTTDVNAASWSIDNFFGGPVKQHTDAIMHLQWSLFAYSAWELHGRNLSFHKLLLVKIHGILFPLAFSLSPLLNFRMEYIRLVYGRSMVVVLYF